MLELSTARLRLRPWHLDDRDAFHAIWGDPEVIFWGALDLAGSLALLERVLTPTSGELRWWAAVERESGRVVANMVVQPASFSAGVEIGWHVLRVAQNRGYATEAARALIDHYLPHVRRIVAAILPENVRSQRVAEKLGMQRQGTVIHASLPHELWVSEA